MSNGIKKVTIETAKQVAKVCEAEGVVIIAFGPDEFSATSYGVNRPMCRKYASVCDQIADMMIDGRIEIPTTEAKA